MASNDAFPVGHITSISLIPLIGKDFHDDDGCGYFGFRTQEPNPHVVVISPAVSLSQEEFDGIVGRKGDRTYRAQFPIGEFHEFLTSMPALNSDADPRFGNVDIWVRTDDGAFEQITSV